MKFHFTFQLWERVGKLKQMKAQVIKIESKSESMVRTCLNVTWNQSSIIFPLVFREAFLQV